MQRQRYRRSKKAGLPPGSLVHIGEKKIEKVRITVIAFDSERYEEKELSSIEDSFAYRDKHAVAWINIDGIHKVDILEKLGANFGIHPLVLEDVLNTVQRPKMEVYDDYIFTVLKILQYNERDRSLNAEQFSIILGYNYIISFQEKEGEVFNTVKDRIRNNKGRIRKMGTDYLFYTLLDTVVDSYFIILEKMEEWIDELEDELLKNPSKNTMHEIHRLKREMIFLRKSIWPLREVISELERRGSSLIKETTGVYLRDVYDHTIQIIDTVENFRDMVSGMLDIYLSSISNRLNEIMKLLTIIATIFIPLTFIAGVYGMNFNTGSSPWNMPELNWHYGYPFILAVMWVIGSVMLIYFRRRKWL